MRCYSTNLVCAQLLVGFEKTVSCIISTLLKAHGIWLKSCLFNWTRQRLKTYTKFIRFRWNLWCWSVILVQIVMWLLSDSYRVTHTSSSNLNVVMKYFSDMVAATIIQYQAFVMKMTMIMLAMKMTLNCNL